MSFLFFFFLNDPAPPEIYPLPLHDALPIPAGGRVGRDQLGHAQADDEDERRDQRPADGDGDRPAVVPRLAEGGERSEEHTSELQSRQYLVCRLLLEKKKRQTNIYLYHQKRY